MYEAYRKKYTYEESKSSFPWLVISFNKTQGEDYLAKIIYELIQQDKIK